MAKTQNIPVDIQRFINHIKAMNQWELNEFLQAFKDSNLAVLIAESIKRKSTKQPAI